MEPCEYGGYGDKTRQEWRAPGGTRPESDLGPDITSIKPRGLYIVDAASPTRYLDDV